MVYIRTIIGLYANVLGQPQLLIKLSGLMLVLLVAYRIAAVWFHHWLFFGESPAASAAIFEQNSLLLGAITVAYLLICAWLLVVFSVRWHRYALLNADEDRFFAVGLGKRGRLFAWNSFLILLWLVLAGVLYWIAVLILLPVANNVVFGSGTSGEALSMGYKFSFVLAGSSSFLDSFQLTGLTITDQSPYVAMALKIGFLLICTYLIARMSLVYPAIALGFRMRLSDSWQETRRHGLRITGLLIVMSVPAIVGSEFSFQVGPIAEIPPWLMIAVDAVAQSLFFVISVALFASAFSYAYKTLGLPLRPPQSQRTAEPSEVA
ncbi:MAG: hypothetical protein AAF414_04265 [Pseudomonadota bacterium]